MFVLLLITGIAFIPQGQSLKCNNAMCDTEGECFGPDVECGQGLTRCVVIRQVTYNENLTLETDALDKRCIEADACKNASYHDVAMTRYYMTKCCEGDLCNKDLLPPLPTGHGDPNGRKCSFCGGPYGLSCNKIEECKGDRTHCYTTLNFERGCVSESFCANASISRGINTHYKCCEGELCNSSSRISACALLLITALMLLFSQ